MIKKIFLKNLANIITLIRVILIFIVLLFLSDRTVWVRMCGGILLVVAFVLDGIDGILAKVLHISNNIGSLIDTLGDRITENVLLVFFAYNKVIPLAVPVIFIARSFMADFIRFLAFKRGIGTFSITCSRIGSCLVASRTSRVTYLFLKFFVFFAGALLVIYQEARIGNVVYLPTLIVYAAIIATLMNLVRFVVLVYDSRDILRQTFVTE